MSPDLNNEVRDLQPLVRSASYRSCLAALVVLACAAAMTLAASVRTALASEEVCGVSHSGQVACLTPLPKEKAKEALARGTYVQPETGGAR